MTDEKKTTPSNNKLFLVEFNVTSVQPGSFFIVVNKEEKVAEEAMKILKDMDKSGMANPEITRFIPMGDMNTEQAELFKDRFTPQETINPPEETQDNNVSYLN